MLGSYPLSRCPACKKAFRKEIEDATTSRPSLGVIACPHCGLKFQRFDLQSLQEPGSQPAAR